jgi:hypothetical protein
MRTVPEAAGVGRWPPTSPRQVVHRVGTGAVSACGSRGTAATVYGGGIGRTSALWSGPEQRTLAGRVVVEQVLAGQPEHQVRETTRCGRTRPARSGQAGAASADRLARRRCSAAGEDHDGAELRGDLHRPAGVHSVQNGRTQWMSVGGGGHHARPYPTRAEPQDLHRSAASVSDFAIAAKSAHHKASGSGPHPARPGCGPHRAGVRRGRGSSRLDPRVRLWNSMCRCQCPAYLRTVPACHDPFE